MGTMFAVVLGSALIGACLIVLGLHFFLKIVRPDAFLPVNVQPRPQNIAQLEMHVPIIEARDQVEHRVEGGIELLLSDSMDMYWSDTVEKRQQESQQAQRQMLSALIHTEPQSARSQTSTQQSGHGTLLYFPNPKDRTGVANGTFSSSSR